MTKPGIDSTEGSSALPSDYRLRPALPQDAPALHAFCLPEWSQASVWQMLARIQKAALNRRGLGLVAVIPSGELIGFGQLTLWPRVAEICDVIVAAGWRGRGIGSAIIRGLIRAAGEMAMRRVEIGVALRNERARQLYRRLGFVEGRIIDLDLGDGPEPVMYLALDIAPPNAHDL